MDNSATKSIPADAVPTRLVEAVYATLDDSALWGEALRQICEHMGTTWAGIATFRGGDSPDPTTAFVHWGALGDAGADSIAWPFPEQRVGLAQLQLGVVQRIEDVHDRAGKPRGSQRGAVVRLFDDEKARVVFATLRPSEHGPVDDQAVASLSELSGHLRIACTVHEHSQRRAAEQDLLASVFSDSSLGYIVLDQTGAVVKVNQHAHEILRAGTLLALREERLCATSADDDARLQRVLGQFLSIWDDGASGEVVVLGQQHGRTSAAAASLRLVIMSTRPGPTQLPAPEAPVAVVYLLNPAAPLRVDHSLLKRLYGLSDTEATVAVRLAHGLSVAEISEALDVSHHTTRTHLKNLFAKTNTTQQSALVSLVLAAS